MADTLHDLALIIRSRSLSVVMAAKVEGLREWAAGRTVTAD